MKSLKIANWRNFETPKGADFSKSVVERFHLERDGNGVKIVSDGFVDVQKEIDSEAQNAGLVNILKQQELRYGTVQNAIVRNEAKQVYAKVSDIPTNVAEQAEYIAKVQAEVNALKAKLGLDEAALLNLTEEKYKEIIASQNAPKESEVIKNE